MTLVVGVLHVVAWVVMCLTLDRFEVPRAWSAFAGYFFALLISPLYRLVLLGG